MLGYLNNCIGHLSRLLETVQTFDKTSCKIICWMFKHFT